MAEGASLDADLVKKQRAEIESFLKEKLLPFWFERCKDTEYGGFLSHFDEHGSYNGDGEKTLIAQSRMVYSFSAAYRAGYGEKCLDFAEHGFDFLVNTLWDKESEGFFWMVDRQGRVTKPDKVVYGHSFAIYALSEYALASGDKAALHYAERIFDLLQKHAADTCYGGYFEMFDRKWQLAGPGSAGGDRKTLDAHMHLMEAFTRLYECSGRELHQRKLKEIISLIKDHILHPDYATGIPQFSADWRQLEQIKFDIVWGWDRFNPEGLKGEPLDNTSYGHNMEFCWLLCHALDILGEPLGEYREILEKNAEHCYSYGIDWEYGGVFVEGSHHGPARDLEKEFWQQCEVMIGLLEAYLRLGLPKYVEAYNKVHDFMFQKVANHETGELWPLLTREGKPIWRHMSHSWKINYHSIRMMIETIKRLDKIERR